MAPEDLSLARCYKASAAVFCIFLWTIPVQSSIFCEVPNLLVHNSSATLFSEFKINSSLLKVKCYISYVFYFKS